MKMLLSELILDHPPSSRGLSASSPHGTSEAGHPHSSSEGQMPWTHQSPGPEDHPAAPHTQQRTKNSCAVSRSPGPESEVCAKGFTGSLSGHGEADGRAKRESGTQGVGVWGPGWHKAGST